MKSFGGVTVVQRLGFSFVVRKVDVLGTPKLIGFSKTFCCGPYWDEMGVDVLAVVSEFRSSDLNNLPLWNESTQKSDLIAGRLLWWF